MQRREAALIGKGDARCVLLVMKWTADDCCKVNATRVPMDNDSSGLEHEKAHVARLATESLHSGCLEACGGRRKTST